MFWEDTFGNNCIPKKSADSTWVHIVHFADEMCTFFHKSFLPDFANVKYEKKAISLQGCQKGTVLAYCRLS